MTEENKLYSVGTNMHKARVFLKEKGYNASERQQILDSIRRDIPNARLCNCKFLMGVSRMYVAGEISSEEVSYDLNNALHFISDDTHVNEYDYNLNGETASTISSRFKISEADKNFEDTRKKSIESSKKLKVNESYTIVPIDNYAEASKYGQYTSWCVTHGESAYNNYTSGGAGRFYFCLKKGFEKVRETRGEGCPLDEYGLSMIAVSITAEGESNTITCRWNHDNGGGDSIMTVPELEKLLGRSFYETFLPYTDEELKAKGMYVSSKIGKYFLNYDKEIEGIIASVDENDNPKIIIDIEEEAKSMTWYEAMEYNKTLTNGWHIPTIDEMNSIWTVKGYNNIITRKLNRGIENYNNNIYNKVRVEGDYIVWNNKDGIDIKYNIHQPVII